MRLLIGSDGPASIDEQADVRAFTQRVLWFARDDDAIVLMAPPDRVFVDHVAGLTGVNSSRLRFHVTPSRWTGGNFDAWSMLDLDFQDELVADAVEATEIVALWPCPEVGWLARGLEVEKKLAGAAFWREGGGIIANSKVVFRALAGGAGVEIAPGGVCYSHEDAFRVSGHLLRNGAGFVVKREHGGGGSGNEIVSASPVEVSHAGHLAAEVVSATAEGLEEYWRRRWDWATNDGARPCVVETFIPDARTLYVETVCTDAGVSRGRVGELKFQGGRIAAEVFPAQRMAARLLSELEAAAQRLAQAYQAMGYRGRLSLDAVVTPSGQIFFTEANARFTSSTHLYEAISDRVAQAEDRRDRVVLQVTTPASWKLDDLGLFLATLERYALAFDTNSRTGVLAVTPIVHGTGQLMIAAIGTSEQHAKQLLDAVQVHVRNAAG